MKIERKRYVVMRKNRTEIWCGLAREFHFKPIDNIGQTAIKTYRTANQAKKSFPIEDMLFEIVPVVETIEVAERKDGAGDA